VEDQVLLTLGVRRLETEDQMVTMVEQQRVLEALVKEQQQELLVNQVAHCIPVAVAVAEIIRMG